MARVLKDKISSPLEAGTSILDGFHLPPSLTPALDYASKRLARKALHITCVVVRRDYELPSPTLPSSSDASGFSTPVSVAGPASFSRGNTPVRPAFLASGLDMIKHLVWPNLLHNDDGLSHSRSQSLDLQRVGAPSPAFSDRSLQSSTTYSTASTSSTMDSTFTSTNTRWVHSSAQSPSIPMTPATPFTVASSATATTETESAASGVFPNMLHPLGMKLLHANPLNDRENKGLRTALERAARKFKIGPQWLSDPIAPSSCGLTADLIDRSVLQNEVLYSSDGLTLLALDRIYAFKSAVRSYARTKSPCKLEDAVDELRRLVLGNGMRKLRKSTLVHQYTWLGTVTDAALQDVCRMYHKAYGSDERDNGIENDMDVPCWPLPACTLSAFLPTLAVGQGTFVVPDNVPTIISDDFIRTQLATPGKLPFIDTLEEEEEQALVRSTTPKLRADTASVSSFRSSSPCRKKSVPETPELVVFSQPEDPQGSGSCTPRSTATEQSETAHSNTSERADLSLQGSWSEDTGTRGLEIELDMDQIEDWYREVDIDLNTVNFRPAPPTELAAKQPLESKQVHASPPLLRPIPRPQPQATAKAGMLGLKLDTTFGIHKRKGPAKGFPVKASMDAMMEMAKQAQERKNNGSAQQADSLDKLDLDLGGEDTEEELTARPPDSAHPATDGLRGFVRWNSVSIDSILSPVEGPSERGDRVGPMTPNGYEDISPVTRGEWGFLMVGGEWKNGRQVNVTSL